MDKVIQPVAAGKHQNRRDSVASVDNIESVDNVESVDKSNDPGLPPIVPLRFPDKDSLQKAYMNFLKTGGLFFSTTHNYRLQEEVFLLVTLPGGKKPVPLPGTVVWRSPSSSVDGHKAGIGIEFKGKEGNALKINIEGILGPRLSSVELTDTM